MKSPLLAVAFAAACLTFPQPARTEGADAPQTSGAPFDTDAPTVLVHVKGVGGAFVETRRRDGTWERACATPCDRPLAKGGVYRVNGPSMKPSSPFRLDGSERAEVVVAPASIVGGVLGGVLAGGGGLVLIAGLFHSLDGALTICDAPPPERYGRSECQTQRDRTQQAAQAEGRTLMLAGAALAVTGALVFAATADSATRVEVVSDRARERDRARPRIEARSAAAFAPARDTQSGVPTPKLPFVLPVLSGSF